MLLTKLSICPNQRNTRRSITEPNCWVRSHRGKRQETLRSRVDAKHGAESCLRVAPVNACGSSTWHTWLSSEEQPGARRRKQKLSKKTLFTQLIRQPPSFIFLLLFFFPECSAKIWMSPTDNEKKKKEDEATFFPSSTRVVTALSQQAPEIRSQQPTANSAGMASILFMSRRETVKTRRELTRAKTTAQPPTLYVLLTFFNL